MDLPNRSNTPEANETRISGRFSLFDAVPFLACPPAAPHGFCVGATEQAENKESKERVKLPDGSANVAGSGVFNASNNSFRSIFLFHLQELPATKPLFINSTGSF
jgi:hypothetical protein